MRVLAQVAMVMNLDKCIGCHTCSVTCEQAWTNRAGTPAVRHPGRKETDAAAERAEMLRLVSLLLQYPDPEPPAAQAQLAVAARALPRKAARERDSREERAAGLLVQAESKPDNDLPRKEDLMTSDEPLRENPEPAAEAVPATSGTLAAAEPGEAREGGDPACWACLVCQECGAVISEGHRAGCSRIATQPAAGDSAGGNGRTGTG